MLGHLFLTGEIALGSFRQRNIIVAFLRRLPAPAIATNEDVMSMIEQHSLFGRGISYVDAHLLASVRITPGALLWTRDKRLLACAKALGVDAQLD